jgi:hypothetical protein
MANPYDKWLGKEDVLQHKIIKYLEFNYPKSIWTHVGNEGRRTKFERFKIKYLGVKAGVPDVLIFTPNKKYNGLAIELKIGYNKPTDTQKKWLSDLKKCNWFCCVQKDFDSAVNLINQYFKNDL